MHPPEFRERALKLRADGIPFGEICRVLGLPRRTVGNWFYGDRPRRRAEREATKPRCARCADPPRDPPDAASYAYLLGLYLGDGHLVTSTKVPVLRVYCTAAWPGLVEACEEAMLRALARKVHRVTRNGCVVVGSSSVHWPCFFPQHGPGKKHERPIILADWQQIVVHEHPESLLRGLFHSDGCRATNRVRHGAKIYDYPRYNFSNESVDIMRLCQESLDRLGISWRMCRPNMLSVARREAVARLDEFVGPKW
ncbi:helix-turn-helix domain-containing protein [Actinoplanes sp. TBRC 11911]|uniref:helix-turn-helix domain-containing protein n=1 Tax=Actinoplanes sp. TBRC 11911 TaxID=2729386 RepID=UPI00145F75DE|nr:helix-turn-helix domain-containing protein [Actinoplanes sp. TBRC 11911]NMO56674.1 helix-turn-helix domain-containing protein [Actinoplanes sp. TBRC 11911]